ncbi:MAG TPA: translesion error-prone DNA polymerase V autoproteolytic subunit [Flavitalea sp.]|nr:translesion error-prone DNA polymerase V autoproteolytic subunit [Flavitalea sp.]
MIPVYRISVPAGFPSPALDYTEERISLDKEFVPNPLSTFMVECTGDSMINAFIPPGARLLVDRSLTPKNGDIVLAELDGEFTVKFLKKNEFRCWLVPANPKYREISIRGEQTLKVWGVVTTIITETKIVRGCMR